MNVYSILTASLIPLAFLYVVKWLNFFETHRFRLILVALVWGALAVELSYLVDHPIRLVLGVQFVGTRTAPTVEEIFKSLVLLYLVRRADTTFFVDGAVYGFAAGIGFAIAENMLYLSRVDVDTGVVVATTRAFCSSAVRTPTRSRIRPRRSHGPSAWASRESRLDPISRRRSSRSRRGSPERTRPWS